MSKNLEFIVAANTIGVIYPVIANNRRVAGVWNNRMEKTFSLLRSFVDVGGKAKFCVDCVNMATQEALFDVDGATIIEKYCDKCAKKVGK